MQYYFPNIKNIKVYIILCRTSTVVIKRRSPKSCRMELNGNQMPKNWTVLSTVPRLRRSAPQGAYLATRRNLIPASWKTAPATTAWTSAPVERSPNSSMSSWTPHPRNKRSVASTVTQLSFSVPEGAWMSTSRKVREPTSALLRRAAAASSASWTSAWTAQGRSVSPASLFSSLSPSLPSGCNCAFLKDIDPIMAPNSDEYYSYFYWQ